MHHASIIRKSYNLFRFYKNQQQHTMKKVLLSSKIVGAIKRFLSFERKPCEIMIDLKFKSITVVYPATVVLESIERPETVKVWNVAVKTSHPEFQPKSHAEWMVNVQMSRANTAALIGEIEKRDILSDTEKYSQNVPVREFIKVKENNR